MTKDNFNDNADKFGDYNFFVRANDPTDALFKTGSVKDLLQDWLEYKTGVSPYIAVNDDNSIFLRCRRSIADQILKEFAIDIERAERIKTREEIIQDDIKNGGDGGICWRPRK